MARASAQGLSVLAELQADPAARFALTAQLVVPERCARHVAAEVARSGQRNAAWPECGLVVLKAPLPAGVEDSA